MAHKIRRVDYFYFTVDDQPGEAYKLLSLLNSLGVNLLALTLLPMGPSRTQIAVFPEDPGKLKQEAERAKLILDGPHPALMATGDDELGALVGLHEKLAAANVNVVSSTAVTDGKGDYGYVVYVRPEDYPMAASALEI